MGTSLLLQIVLAFVSLGIVVIGWVVLYSNAKKIATRNETFAITRELTSIIDTLRDKGCDMWSKQAAADQELEWGKMRSNIGSIREFSTFLSKSRGIDIPLENIIDLRRALSLNLEKVKKSDSSEVCRDSISRVSSTCNSFKLDVLKQFEEKHPPE